MRKDARRREHGGRGRLGSRGVHQYDVHRGGGAKLVEGDRFRDVLSQLAWIPSARVPLLVRAVPLVELAIAALVILRPTLGMLVAAGALIVFSSVAGVELRAGRRFDCGCFGATRAPLGARWTLSRNVMLLAAAGVALLTSVEPGIAPALTGVGLAVVLIAVEWAAATWQAGHVALGRAGAAR